MKEEMKNFIKDLFGDFENGYVGILSWNPRDKENSSPAIQRWIPVNEIEAICKSIEVLSKKKNENVYFTCGVRGNDLGNHRVGTKEEVAGISALWLDVDIAGTGHSDKNLVPDEKTAFELVNSFPFPFTYSIHTGNGYHLYWQLREPWIFENDNERDEAQQLLSRFQKYFIAMFKLKEFSLDNTSNLNRILRPPETVNCKLDCPDAEVKIVDHNDIRMDPSDFIDFLDIVEETVNSQKDIEESENKKVKVPSGFTLPVASKIFEKCELMKLWETTAQTHTEKAWTAGLTIICRCEDGKELCHKISSAYPKYLHKETEGKLNHLLRDTKPFHCNTLREHMHDSKTCESCPYNEKIKSPVALGFENKNDTKLKDEENKNNFSELLKPYFCSDLINDLKKSGTGISTGYSKLDNSLSIPPGGISIVAGSTSHGKTSMMLNLMLNMIELYPEKCFVFITYEDSKINIVSRIISNLSSVVINKNSNFQAIKKRIMQPHSSKEIENGKAKFDEYVKAGRLLIIQPHELSVIKLISFFGYLEASKNKSVGAIFIDYIQKIPCGINKGTRYQELQFISNSLQTYITKMPFPLIMGAQIGKVDSKDKMKLGSVREALDIEQDASTVMYIWNRNKQSDTSGFSTDTNPLDIKIVKCKDRRTPVECTLQFHPQTMKITE